MELVLNLSDGEWVNEHYLSLADDGVETIKIGVLNRFLKQRIDELKELVTPSFNPSDGFIIYDGEQFSISPSAAGSTEFHTFSGFLNAVSNPEKHEKVISFYAYPLDAEYIIKKFGLFHENGEKIQRTGPFFQELSTRYSSLNYIQFFDESGGEVKPQYHREMYVDIWVSRHTVDIKLVSESKHDNTDAIRFDITSEILSED